MPSALVLSSNQSCLHLCITSRLRLVHNKSVEVMCQWGQVPCIIFIQVSLTADLTNLLSAKMSTSEIQGSVTWLIEGISIKDAQ